MTKHVIPFGGATVALLALATSVSADIKINDNVSVAGYATGSFRHVDDKESGNDTFELDTAKFSLLASHPQTPVSAVASVYYTGGSPGDDLTLLDAYVNYDAGEGITYTGGKFLSWLGYEAFDIPNMSQISYANGDFLGAIPGYHSGLKLTKASGAWSYGLAFVDSLYGGLEGDGELGENWGAEAFVSYTNDKLTVFGAYAQQSAGLSVDTDYSYTIYNTGATGMVYAGGAPLNGLNEEVSVYNLWASYKLSADLTVAGEFTFKEGYFVDGYNWLVFASYALDEKTTFVGRISGEEAKSYLSSDGYRYDDASFIKLTFAPGRKITDNLTVRAEVSLYKYDNYSNGSSLFLGVQGVYKF